MKYESVKIYLSYNKDSQRICSDVLVPIHAGRIITSPEQGRRLSDLIGDDTGDNISVKNQSYCELTVQYWVWKNRRSDYAGFMHYRRHLAFKKIDRKANIWGLSEYPFVNDDYLDRIGLDDNTIISFVSDYDIVTVEQWDVSNAGSKNNYDHYKSSSKYLRISDYDTALDILKDRFPEYAPDAEAYNNSRLGYYTNIFVMKWEIFDEYCKFLFTILEELEKHIDLSKRNTQEKRVFGYVSEWLLGIFITHKKSLLGCRIVELPRTIVTNTDIEKGFLEVCSVSDDNYARHLGVAMTSVKINKGSEKIRYWILCNGVSEDSKERLMSLESDDFRICFVDIDG